MVLLAAACLPLTLFAAASDTEQPSTEQPDNEQNVKTGPETENRFPRLKVPDGFRATLFACDPLVEYPSVIALGPRSGTLFVAHDYMTGLGTEIVRRDEVRLLEDTDGDGYADQTTFCAGGFNSIQGLAYDDGTVFVMHSPFLTAVRDKDGDGHADERRDLLSGLGLPPEENPPRLHCANGVTAGYDGWLYLALGDHGCDVERPEGDRLVFRGGGILRCRPDGRDLHVFSTGLRNIYDVALDEHLNVFVRDNENDGGEYMVRVCHSFFGADHGYPYLYIERPDEAMPPLADLGRGSSAGGVCYLETAFPAPFRGNLFFCEWGRSVVRYERITEKSSFTGMQEIEFVAGAADDPYGFKPTDIVVDRDGSLLISDWADGQRPKRGRGRIYRITYVGQQSAAAEQSAAQEEGTPSPAAASTRSETRDTDDSKPRAESTPLEPSHALGQADSDVSIDDWIDRLQSPSDHVRREAQLAIERTGVAAVERLRRRLELEQLAVAARRHAVWVLTHTAGSGCIDTLFELAKNDSDEQVRVQAVRALADLCDPVLTEHRLDAGRGDSQLAARLAMLADNAGPDLQRELIIALGRLRWAKAANWLRRLPRDADAALLHAAQQTLRQSDNWPAVLELLDEPDDSPTRSVALKAVADRADPVIVEGVLERLDREPTAARRREYADILSRVCRKPAEWVYWGYRPAPRPANSTDWEHTDAIAGALDRLLSSPDHELRMFVLGRMRREQIAPQLATLYRWLSDSPPPAHVTAILESLENREAGNVRELLTGVVASRKFLQKDRRTALGMYVDGLNRADASKLLVVAESLEDGPVLAAAIRELSGRVHIDCRRFLVERTASADAGVRAAAVEAMGTRKLTGAGLPIATFLDDRDLGVRRAAVSTVGIFGEQGARSRLLTLLQFSDAELRRRCLISLRQLEEPAAVEQAVSALEDGATQLAALQYLGDFGGAPQLNAVTQVLSRNRSVDLLNAGVRALSSWEEREPQAAAQLKQAVARVHGESGLLLRWQVRRFESQETASQALDQLILGDELPSRLHLAGEWQTLMSSDSEGRIELEQPAAAAGAQASASRGQPKGSTPAGTTWLALSDILVNEPGDVSFLTSSDGTLAIWLNGRNVYRREMSGKFQLDSDRFDRALVHGMNHLLVKLTATAETSGTPVFHVRFRRKSSTAVHEQMARSALRTKGNAERGRKLFLNSEKSLCLRCHRLGHEGERVGPDLTGIGRRFSRVHLIESLLEPNRTIAPSYEAVAVALSDGRVVVGVKVAETTTTLTIGDNQGKTHAFDKSEIDEINVQTQSVMPDGIERRLTETEFVDLIAFLASQTKRPTGNDR